MAFRYADLTPFDCPGYRAGTDGNVYSDRNINQRDAGKLKPFRHDKTKKLTVTLHRADGLRVRHLALARLILEAFGKPSPGGRAWIPEHVNGDDADCRFANLRWVPKTGNGKKRMVLSVTLKASEYRRLTVRAGERSLSIPDAVRRALRFAGLI